MAGWRMRPATPLTFFLLVAFILLLLSTLSTPIIKSIPLGSYNGQEFGVFGYCTPSFCSNLGIGYAIPDLNSPVSSTMSRHTLSSILIVHPVAALLTLICTILAAASHFRGPAHSPRYLLALLILIFPTLLVTLLAFLVDILLLIPHMRWGGWIVLVATILITGCMVLTCAMRRTLVSRRARQKRIEQNNDMNGANFYAMQGALQQQPLYPRAESPPPLTVVNGNDANKLPQFATFQVQRPRIETEDRTPLTARESSGNTQSTGGLRNRTDTTRRVQGGESLTPVSATTGPSVQPTTTAIDTVPSAVVSTRTRDDTVSPIDERLPPANIRANMPLPRSPPEAGVDGFPTGLRPLPTRIGDPRAPPPMYGRGRAGYPPPRGGYAPRGYAPRGSYGREGQRYMPPSTWNGAPRGMVPRGMMRGRAPPPGYPRRPIPGRPLMEDDLGYEDRGDVAMPHGPDFMDYSRSQNRYAGESADLPDVERFARNPSYSTRDPSDRIPLSNYPPNSSGVPTPSEDFNAQPIGDGRFPPQRHSWRNERADEGYERRPVEGERAEARFTEPDTFDASPSYSYERQHSGNLGRDPASFGFSGTRPSGRRNEEPLVDSLVSPPPFSPYSAHQGQALEMDANDARPADPQLHQQDQMLSAELDSHELGPAAPSGDHGHGMYLPRHAWQPEPAELGNTSPQQPRAELSGSPIDYRPTAELPEGGSPPEHTYAAFSPISTTDFPSRHRTTSSDVYIEDVEPRFASDGPPVTSFQQSPSWHAASQLPNDNGNDDIMSNPYGPEAVIPLDPVSRSANRSPAQSDGSNFTSISQRQINPNWRPPPGPARRPPPQDRYYQPDQVLASNPDFSLPGAPSIARRPLASGPRVRGGMSSNIGPGSIGMAQGSPTRATREGSHQYFDGL